MRKVYVPILIAWVTLSLAWPVTAQDAEPWNRAAPTPESLEAALRTASAAKASLEAGDVDKALTELGFSSGIAGRIDEWLKAVQERIEALDPKLLAATLQEAGALRSLVEVRALEARARQLPVPTVVSPPAVITREEMEAIRSRGSRLQEQLDAAERTWSLRNEQLSLVKRQSNELPAERDRLNRMLDGWEAVEGDPLDAYRRATLRLRQRTVQERISFAERAKPVWEVLLTVRELERETARNLLAAQQELLAAAQKRYDDRAVVKAERLEGEAESKRLAASADGIPEAERRRLLDSAEIDEIRADIIRDELLTGRIRKRTGEEDSENQSLLETQEWLRERFSDEEGGRSVSSRTVQLLLSTLERVRQGRRRLDGELLAEREKFLGAYLGARGDVEDRLQELTGEQEREKIRAELRERRTGLEEMKSAVKGLDRTYGNRRELFRELYPFLVGRAYRVQSDDPLGLSTLSGIRREFVALATLYAGAELWRAAGRAPSPSWKYALAGIAFVVLVVLGIVLTRRLRRYQSRWKYRGGTLSVLLQRTGASLLVSALAPGCLALSLLPLAFLDLPEALAQPGGRLLLGAAVIIFARRFLWSLMREGGIAREDMHAPGPVADQLLGFSRWITAAFLFLWLPWWVLRGEPLELVHIPRVLYTALLVVMAVLLTLLIRREGALVAALTKRKGFRNRAWAFLGPLISFGLFAIVLMDILGYRVGARMLAVNVAETIVAGLVLAGAYNLVTVLVGQAAARLRNRRRAAVGAAEARKEASEVERQVTRFIGVTVVAVTVLLLAKFWGIADGVAGLLGSVGLYGEYLSLWDVLIALFWIVGGHFVVRHLPALYEVLVFNRMGKVETGTRYVVIAVSKYVVLIVAYASAALAIRLSFESLGYILAALSLGIGFGLQEIVSNFVAGLILLFERPIRVGDLISVGTTLGTVEKINIRSTEVVNLDRQVIIIPNRKFITEDVTNWTHNDLLIRTTVDVGVSYGSDVEKVGRVLLETVRNHPRVLPDPEPKALFMTFGDSSLNMRVLFFTLIDDRVVVRSEMNGLIHKRFAEEGIEIPYPQRDLHVRSVQDDTLLAALDPGAAGRLPEGAKIRRGRKKARDEPSDPPTPEGEAPSAEA